jgi:hypothetical protein
VGFVVYYAATEQAVSEYFDVPCHLFIPLIATQSSRDGKMGQMWPPDSGLGSSPAEEII